MSENEITLSNKSIQKAGKIIRKADENSLEYHQAIELLTTWRNQHAIALKSALLSVTKKLNREGIKNYVLVQRLKRMPSIIYKVRRLPNMDASRMQDVGGLRIILPSVSDVLKVSKILTARSSNIVLTDTYNYIANPKQDGYRSIHLVYKYVSKTHPLINGYFIEIQLRTQLQHYWSTAVETLGMIDLKLYKTGEGDQPTRRFFLLTSGLFAINEKTNLPAELIQRSSIDIANEVKSLENKIHILQKLKGLAVSLKEKKVEPGDYYYVLQLTVEAEGKSYIKIISYKENSREEAESYYHFLENYTRNKPNVSVLLIRAESFKNIRIAYPNYFLDTMRFATSLEDLIKKAAPDN